MCTPCLFWWSRVIGGAHLCVAGAFQPLPQPSENLTLLRLLKKTTFDPRVWLWCWEKQLGTSWLQLGQSPLQLNADNNTVGTKDRRRCDINWLCKARKKGGHKLLITPELFRVISGRCNFCRESCLLRFGRLLKVKSGCLLEEVNWVKACFSETR